MSNIFEEASRKKLRFDFKGLLSVEDLWDLSVEHLDNIFKKLNKDLKVQEEESLLATKSQADALLDLKVAIIKHIVDVKLVEQADRENAAEKRARKNRLLTILERKQNEELEDLPAGEIEKLIAELG